MTLVEMVCVLAILAILCTVATPYLLGWVQEAKDTVDSINKHNMGYVSLEEIKRMTPAPTISASPTPDSHGNKGGNGNHYGWDKQDKK